MNWYKKSLCLLKLKIASLRGEFWIDDSGMALEASGLGEYNHESHAIESAQNYLSEGLDYEEWKKSQAQKVLEEKKENLEEIKAKLEDENKDTSELNKELYDIWEKSRNLNYYYYEIIINNLDNLDIDLETFKIAEGQGDARLYAIKRWGWKRLEGNNVETWTLTKKDLNCIAKGLYEAYFDQVDNEEFNIYLYSNKKWYSNIPYDTIEKSNPFMIRRLQHSVW